METEKDDCIFKIQRNLSDAGCDAPMTGHFLELMKKQKRQEQYQLLSRHRSVLLDKLHLAQYQIDCLDYLIYSMKKEDGGL